MKTKLGGLVVLVALSSVVLMLGYQKYSPMQVERVLPKDRAVAAPAVDEPEERPRPSVKPEAPSHPSVAPDEKPEANHEVTLYVAQAKGNEMRLSPVKEKLASTATPLSALKALAAYDGPGDRTLPKGTKVLSVKTDATGIATANFSREIMDNFPGGSQTEQILLASIVNTLTQFPSVRRVKILVEGQAVDSIGGHIELDEPLERDLGMVAKSPSNEE